MESIAGLIFLITFVLFIFSLRIDFLSDFLIALTPEKFQKSLAWVSWKLGIVPLVSGLTYIILSLSN